MHSLEDILQRLVPARDDSFGDNPFLVAPVIRGYSAVPTADDANEIVSIGEVRSSGSPRAGSSQENPSTKNSSNSGGNSGWTDPTETQATTSIYVVGVVAVIPLAGVVLWIVRVQLHKRREVKQIDILFFQSDHFGTNSLTKFISFSVDAEIERIGDVIRNGFPQKATTGGSDSIETRPPILRCK